MIEKLIQGGIHSPKQKNIGMPLTCSGRKWYRLLRRTDVENDKLFDVNDLPKAEQKWERYRKTNACTKKNLCLRNSFIIPMWNLNCTRRRHTQSDPPKIMLNRAKICVDWGGGRWREEERLNNITSMSLKLKSNLDLKTQVQIIDMPQTYLGRPAARTHVPGSSLM